MSDASRDHAPPACEDQQAACTQSFYLGAGDDAAFVTLHRASTSAPATTSVLICPPFGWEEVCAYRCLREWARELADAGFVTMRLTLPSTGDGGGAVRDPARVQAWTEAVTLGAAWLHGTIAAARVAAIGLGLGGLLAYRAAALGAELDDLVLWATPSRGRALVRGLKAFSGIERTEFFAGLPTPEPPIDGLEAGGFCMSDETVRDLEAVDLATLGLPDAGRRRALLLERDGIAVDERLRKRLNDDGVAVSVQAGPGYASMTSHPQQSRPASETFARVAEWLRAAPPAQPRAPTGGEPPPRAGELLIGGPSTAPAWSERPIWLAAEGRNLSAILTSPGQPRADGVCAVLLNAGAVRRIGPSRMWVQTARRWAASGIPVVRADVSGIGDSDGPVAPYSRDGSLYEHHLLAEVLAMLDGLERSGVGRRFVLGGLCAGAYWSLHLLLSDPRVESAIMLNPRALVWHEGLAPARHLRTLLNERPSLARIRQTATPRLVLDVVRWLLQHLWRRVLWSLGRSSSRTTDESGRLLTRLREVGKPAMFLFSEHEPLREELTATGAMAMLAETANVTLELVAVRDHTMRPTVSQRQAQEAMDRALQRTLAAVGVSGPNPPCGLAPTPQKRSPHPETPAQPRISYKQRHRACRPRRNPDTGGEARDPPSGTGQPPADR